MNKWIGEWTAMDKTWPGKILSRFLEKWSVKIQATETGISAPVLCSLGISHPAFVIV